MKKLCKGSSFYVASSHMEGVARYAALHILSSCKLFYINYKINVWQLVDMGGGAGAGKVKE